MANDTNIVDKFVMKDGTVVSLRDTTALRGTSVTYAELKALRDVSNLTLGGEYRITDYVATTNGDMDSCSANHPFDIIVTATGKNTLSEIAKAAIHEGDTYFANSDLDAWEILYCLDNDTSRFAWALADGETDVVTSTEGRGIVYRIKDEFGNDAPYDFKGILFRSFGNVALYAQETNLPKRDEGLCYIKTTEQVYKWDESTGKYVARAYDASDIWRYTFDSGTEVGTNTDYSLDGKTNAVYENVILPYIATGNSTNLPAPDKGLRKLNANVFCGTSCYSNELGVSCFFNFIGGDYSSTVPPSYRKYPSYNDLPGIPGGSGESETPYTSFTYVTLDDNKVYKWTGSEYVRYYFWGTCVANKIGYYSYSNVLGFSDTGDVFGSLCNSNKFGDTVKDVIFSNDCYNNRIDRSCTAIKFGSHCYNNYIGSDSYALTFGEYAYYVAVGINSRYSTIGNFVNNLTFGTKPAVFSTANTYNPGDAVFYQRYVYRCVKAHTGAWNSLDFVVDYSVATQGYYRGIRVNDDCQYIFLDCTSDRIIDSAKSPYDLPPDTPEDEDGHRAVLQFYQNVEIKSGIKGSMVLPQIISDADFNQTYNTTYQLENSKTVDV